MASSIPHINEATLCEKPKVLGVVTLAVKENGITLLSHASGRTNLNATTNQAISEDSIFSLASCTKIITVIAALRLVQDGRLDLDDPSIVKQHLPELWEQPVITSSPGELVTLENRRRDITVRSLITHTSGSGMELMEPSLKAWRQSREEPPASLTDPLPNCIATPLLFQPGEGWAYGSGLDCTGLLISRITGLSLGAFMRKEVFDIVGCDARIGFHRSDVTQHGTEVQTAIRTPTGNLVPGPVIEQQTHKGGGGLFCSPANFIKIIQDIIAPESKLLSPSMREELFKKQFDEGSIPLKTLRDNKIMVPMIMALYSNAATEGSEISINHALGGALITERDKLSGKTTDTMTWFGAMGSMWFASREKGVAAFYGASMFPPGEPVNTGLLREWVADVSKIVA